MKVDEKKKKTARFDLENHLTKIQQPRQIKVAKNCF